MSPLSPIAPYSQRSRINSRTPPQKTNQAFFKTDNEQIYAGHGTQDLCEELGIQWEPSALYTPNQNTVSERTFRTLFRRIQAILKDGGLPHALQGKALNTIIYLKNRSPSSLNKNTTLKEAQMGKKIKLGYLRPFNYTIYIYNNNLKRGKLDNKSIKYKLLSYN